MVEDKNGYDKHMLEYCKKHDLWEGWARLSNMPKVSREETVNKVMDLLSKVITKTSNYTKGALMKYVRENFKGPSAYTDVGKVASKVIKQQLNKWGKWERCTKNNYIRKRR